MHAAFHSEAAVVRPAMRFCAMKIVPAPRKPMPLTTCALMRPTLIATPVASAVRLSSTMSCMIALSSTAITVAPTHTSTCVRMPAGRFFRSRSTPMMPPSSTEMPRRKKISHQSIDAFPPLCTVHFTSPLQSVRVEKRYCT